MLKSLPMLFGPSPKQLAQQQLHDAQVKLLHHAAEAEKHAALAVMYRERRERLATQHIPSTFPALS